MNTSQKYQRAIATFFLLIFFPTLVPTELFANNNGPKAPEAAAFEPVDATDMVNLSTGDMSYTLPLVNVPSPEGGYPLALSYHAGIAMDQEASWAGLGWNVNPGAVNRAINGVPDDWKRTNVNQIIYDAGGVATSYSVGLSVGWGDGQYSVGLYGSYAENKTFGGSTSYSTDFGAMGSFGNWSASIGTDGASVGYDIFGMGKTGTTKFGLNVGVSQSFDDGSTAFSGGINMRELDSQKKYSNDSYQSSLGVSYDTGSGYSVSAIGLGVKLSGGNNFNGGLNISSRIYNVSIPIYGVNISLGYRRSRYWTFDKIYTKFDGSLYAGDMDDLFQENAFSYKTGFDSYNSLYKLNSGDQLEKEDNLSYVSYDNYWVSGQGISGSFSPAIYEDGSLINTYKAGRDENLVTYKFGANSTFSKTIDNELNDIHFYFDNEGSSYLNMQSEGWNTIYASSTPIENMVDNRDFKTDALIDGQLYNGYNSTIKKKRTGSNIEVFTNKQINDNASLVMGPSNFDRTNKPNEGIGAYRITTLDGKVYHYSLPVYQKESFSISTEQNYEFQNRYFEKQELKMYATHWLLTAITGPDYVDTNNNNKVDEADYGYWVEFDYGKWSDGYNWQTPVKTNDSNKFYSWGIKEIYYLDKIKTRTHTALFVKSVRDDDYSNPIQIGQSQSNMSWKDDVSRSFGIDKDGIYRLQGIYNDELMTYIQPSQAAYYVGKLKYAQFVNCLKHKTLKLEKVLLLKNEDANNLTKNSNQDSKHSLKGELKLAQRCLLYYTNGQLIQDKTHVETDTSWYGEFYKNVFDTEDLIGLDLEDKAIKGIKFNYDYSLAIGSRNTSSGRLTLKSLNYLGKSCSNNLPPYKFEYNNLGNYNENSEDNWGYYKDKPENWSLNKIVTPTGGELKISYESDDVDREAVAGLSGFKSKLQFTFYKESNRLKIFVQNEYDKNTIDFTKHFKEGTTTDLDLWASLRHDYDDYGCKARKGSVEIKNETVNVVSVSSNSLLLDVDYATVSSDNGGFGWMSNKVLGLDNHPNHIIREELKWGEYGNPPGCIGNPNDRLVLIYFLKGNMASLSSEQKKGGGIRVKELSVNESGVVKKRVVYSYNMPGYSENASDVNYKSSGVTSYVPQKYFKEVKYITELPSPNVMYEYVTVKNYSSSNALGVVEQYNFEVLPKDSAGNDNDLVLGDLLEIRKNQELQANNYSSNNETYNVNYSEYDIVNNLSALGRLKKKKVFNREMQLMSVFENHYLGKSQVKQGISGETFSTYKRVEYNNTFNDDNDFINYRLGATSKVNYPSVLAKTISRSAGNSSTVYYDKLDFLTGLALETRTESSDGRSFKTKAVPAYTISEYSKMGSKVDNPANRNMLAQNAAEYSYILDNGDWRETGVGITTWNNEWIYQDIQGNLTTASTDKEKIWRKHKAFIWNGVKDSNGIFQNYTNDFAWAIGVGQSSNWKQISEVTKYDHYSMSSEAKDVNDNHAATKMGNNDSQITSVGNAKYNELFYSGIENLSNTNWLEPGISLNGATRDITKYHTGKYSVAVGASGKLNINLKVNQHKAGRYKLNVWVHKDNASNARLQLNGVTLSDSFNGPSKQAGDWILKTHYFNSLTVAETNISLIANTGANVYYDDVMLRPIASSVTGYVYNEWGELWFIVGNNGLGTQYDYTPAGSLFKTYLEVFDDQANGVTGGFKLVSENRQKYKYL